MLKQCACGTFPRHPPDGQFKWGGCGDDIKYGNDRIDWIGHRYEIIHFAILTVAKQFAKSFTDAPLKRTNRKADITFLLASDYSSSPNGHLDSSTTVQQWKQPHIISAINIHNNRVGRKVRPSNWTTVWLAIDQDLLNPRVIMYRWLNKVYTRNASATAFLVKMTF